MVLLVGLEEMSYAEVALALGGTDRHGDVAAVAGAGAAEGVDDRRGGRQYPIKGGAMNNPNNPNNPNHPKRALDEAEVHGYVDGTLVGERRDELERQLAHDEELAARVSDYFALNSLFHQRYDPVLGEPVPAALRGSLLEPEPGLAEGAPAVRRGWKAAANWPQFAGLAAALVLGVGIGVGMNLGRPGPAPVGAESADAGGSPVHLASFGGEEAFARQSALAHVMYTPDVQRPVEVGADQEQDLVQWLSSRLGTSVHRRC